MTLIASIFTMYDVLKNEKMKCVENIHINVQRSCALTEIFCTAQRTGCLCSVKRQVPGITVASNYFCPFRCSFIVH